MNREKSNKKLHNKNVRDMSRTKNYNINEIEFL